MKDDFCHSMIFEKISSNINFSSNYNDFYIDIMNSCVEQGFIANNHYNDYFLDSLYRQASFSNFNFMFNIEKRRLKSKEILSKDEFSNEYYQIKQFLNSNVIAKTNYIIEKVLPFINNDIQNSKKITLSNDYISNQIILYDSFDKIDLEIENIKKYKNIELPWEEGVENKNISVNFNTYLIRNGSLRVDLIGNILNYYLSKDISKNFVENINSSLFSLFIEKNLLRNENEEFNYLYNEYLNQEERKREIEKEIEAGKSLYNLGFKVNAEKKKKFPTIPHELFETVNLTSIFPRVAFEYGQTA